MALRASDKEGAILRPSNNSGGAIVIDATVGVAVVLPSGQFLSNVRYLQQGHDLVLVRPDGATYLVRGYFLLDNPPDLISSDGGRMTAAMVDSFTPPEAAGQYAELGSQRSRSVR